MSTRTRAGALTVLEARRRIAETSFRRADPGALSGGPGKIGLEPEGFPLRAGPDGAPGARLTLAGEDGLLAIMDDLARRGVLLLPRAAEQKPPPWFDLAGGGRITFEPGGQIEHSTVVHPSGAAALDDAQRTTECLAHALQERGAVLAYLGLDLWHDVKDVPQQLDAPRYHCMASYFDKRGEGGRTMMRNTASLQVNLDLGPPGVAEERWMLSNLASPLLTATFASSPKEGCASARARAWQVLDTTRTGFPTPLVDGSDDDPVAHWTSAALSADVMIFWLPDGTSTCGEPGFTFERWIREGHERAGWPTVADLDYHLTTLFFEVRLRGFLELRAIEAVPVRLRAAPAVLVAGLLYDPRARAEGLELLAGRRGELQDLWERAARASLADPELAALARELWPLALAGAERLPVGFFRAEHVAVARDFLAEYALAGRSPADDVREALAVSPASALAWAASSTAACCGEDSAN